MCPRPPYLPADVHLVRKMALDLDVCRVSVRSFEKKSAVAHTVSLSQLCFSLFLHYHQCSNNKKKKENGGETALSQGARFK